MVVQVHQVMVVVMVSLGNLHMVVQVLEHLVIQVNQVILDLVT